MHLQFNYIKPNKLEFLNLPTSNSSFDQILSSKKLHEYSHENIYTTHCILTENTFSLTKNSHHLIHPQLNTISTPLTCMAVSVIMTLLKTTFILLRN